ncbi:MAG: DUF5615 family PIN-like protein [Deltaproteobacteria bacterium]|nr:DUF5615 family PIN-like protein [Deltaproteobacteria bacterium]
MKLKLDENLGYATKGFLLERGCDVVMVREQGLNGSLDEDLLPVVSREERIFVTLDRGFGNVHLYRPGEHAGIVVLRPPKQSSRRIIEMLAILLREVPLSSLDGAVTIVRPNRIRIFSPNPRPNAM